MVRFFVSYAVSCIEIIVSNYFEMFFRDVTDKPFNEIKNRDCFSNKFFILMTVVVKGNIFSIIVINTSGSNYRSLR